MRKAIEKNKKKKIVYPQLLRMFCSRRCVFWFLLFTSGMLPPGCGKKSSAKFQQYYAQGEKLYIQYCSNCHQRNGNGLGLVYPPLDTSDYMENNLEHVICLMRYGRTGELIVNGKQFNQPMAGISSLSDLEIAEIATYIYNTWTHERGIIEVKDASGILNNCR